MLTELRVKNLVLVDEVAFSPGPGLNVISGETGAGKSILVGALELLFGGRGGPDLIRTGSDAARIEGLFQFDDVQFFRKRGLDLPIPDGSLLVVREIARNGRSRILVNDEMATVARLKALGDVLVDLHGQHEHQALLRPDSHVDYLDRFGASLPGSQTAAITPLDNYRRERIALLEAREHLSELNKRLDRADERQDILARDLAEIEAAALKAGEEEELRAERRLLQHAEKLLETAGQASNDMTEGDGSVDHLLAHAARKLGQAAGLDPGLEPLVKQIEEARVSLQDAGYRLARYREGLHFEPDRAETIETRLALITRLKRKYGADESLIAAKGIAFRTELDGMKDEAAWLDSLTADVGRAAEAALRAGKALRAWREEVARKFEKGVALELSTLGMPKARILVRMEPIVDNDRGLLDEEGRAVGLGEKGIDRIEFFLEANPGEEARPLARVASGGELSRIMLALKAVLRSADPLPILIFDEVDAGIGGRVATEVGKRVHEISSGRQVFVITHLPMIACQADHHFRVEKTIERGRTVTRVGAVNGREREEEVARMLAGAGEGPEALSAARALIEAARKGSR